MISVVYLLTSKWHDVEVPALFVLGLIDVLIFVVVLAFLAPEAFT